MNFRSLLIILYLFLIQNRKHYPKASHRCDPEYAPRTRLRYRVLSIVSTLRMTHAVTISEAVRAAYCSTPRVLRGSSLYIKDPKTAFFVVHFLLFSLVFCIVFRAEATPKSRYHTLAPRQVPRSRRSREARFPSRSSAREKFDFRGDLPDLLWITTSISRSVVGSSSDQVSV